MNRKIVNFTQQAAAAAKMMEKIEAELRAEGYTPDGEGCLRDGWHKVEAVGSCKTR